VAATTDHGEIIHGAGFRRLSPALDGQGGPAFSSGPASPGDGLTRCGWAPFFEALQRRDLAVDFGEDEASPPSLVPAASAAHGGAGLAGAMAHARRFWAALTAKPQT
jgi:hypothetical protein